MGVCVRSSLGVSNQQEHSNRNHNLKQSFEQQLALDGGGAWGQSKLNHSRTLGQETTAMAEAGWGGDLDPRW